jgi:hypothetical protein
MPNIVDLGTSTGAFATLGGDTATRLVDFAPRDVLQRIAARIAPLGWHIVV